MCGIAGFFQQGQSLQEHKEYWNPILVQMGTSLSHRGNDDFGTYLSGPVGLSHSRLSIRDLLYGHQPMVRFIREKEYAIAYNGEIYNTKELVQDLQQNGYVLSTTSDTEVILYCFIHYGPDFVTRLNGIFSFAIWDASHASLYLYRDRIGTKPLFYFYNGNSFVFASEQKALFCHPDCSPAFDRLGLQELLSIGPARSEGCGVFKDVCEVRPGHYLTVSKNGIFEQLYWDLTAQEHTDSYVDTVEHVSFLVRDSITRQLVSDVPVCTFLSGGIDSSIVTAVAYQKLQERGETLHTFSFDFAENDKYFTSNDFQPERDLPYVNRMLEQYPTKHTYLECTMEQLYHSLFDAVKAKDLPGMTDVDASLLYFCSCVKKENKVALTGECADEIFGGYPWFYRQELFETDGFPWSSDLSPRTLLLKEEWMKRLELSEFSHHKYEQSLAKAPKLSGESPVDARRRSIFYLCIKWFMTTLLERMDRMSMYSGLEARVPFADPRILDYVFNVPWEMKYQNGTEKALLREATKNLLPKALLHRKKSPYPKTYHPGYEQMLIKKFYEILETPSSPILPLLDLDKTLLYLRSPKSYSKPWFGQLMAGPQLLAYYIQLNFWMESYGFEPV